MAKVIVTFKLEEDIYSSSRQIAKDEGRGISEILREALTDWLQTKKRVSVPDFVAFIREQKSNGRSWAEISSLVTERYAISLTKDQLKSLSVKVSYYTAIPNQSWISLSTDLGLLPALDCSRRT